jgi:hypothetical protein
MTKYELYKQAIAGLHALVNSAAFVDGLFTGERTADRGYKVHGPEFDAWNISAERVQWLLDADAWFAKTMQDIDPTATDGAENPVARAQTKEIFEGFKSQTKHPSSPPEYFASLSEQEFEDFINNLELPSIVILLAKQSISTYKLPWDTQRVMNFDVFTKRYRNLIMG